MPKWTFLFVLGRYWRSRELPKLVISLRTSFKNHYFEQSAFVTWSKPLLEHFWVGLSPQMRPDGASQGGSTNHDFRLPGAVRPAQGSFGLWDPFQAPSQVSFCQIFVRIQTKSWLISNLPPTDYIVKTKKSPKLLCRPPICNACDHWLFVPALNAQYNQLLQWLFPLKSVYLRKSSTQWAIDFSHL